MRLSFERHSMSRADPDPAESLRPRKADGVPRLFAAAHRFVSARREGSVIAWTLGSFVVLWMLYDTVSLATVDLRYDASEAALWAQHFAFGYKHPPMTAWLFAVWFAVFPRADWAMHLLEVGIAAVTLAVTWRILRDHLDRDRALFGLFALLLVPLYTFKTAELNANTIMMPFWAAALLFYLRARRGLGKLDAVLAGAFASFALLGKYWAVYLVAGMAAASFTGAGTRRFWRSPAPYLMAAGAAVVIAPHLYWYVSEAGGSNLAFLRDDVMTKDSFATAFGKSAYYLLGVIAYAAGPLVLLAALRPSRAALADILWPADAGRQQAIVLFAVPLILPALVNLLLPHRLTPDWTFPNWALLPVVLYASRDIAINAAAAAAAGLVALAMSLAFVIASPVLAYVRLTAGDDPNRPNSQQVARAAERIAAKPVRLYWGSPAITGGLPFYLPQARPLDADPLSAAGRLAIEAEELLIVCLDNDAPCQATDAALGGAERRTANVTMRRTFLGFSGPPTTFRVTILPAATHG